MLLTKFGHACVSLEMPGGVKLVIEPGVAAHTPETHALTDADVVLVTHEHRDPGDTDALTIPDRPVETLPQVRQAPWLNAVDQVNYLRAVAPRRTLGVHDGLLSPHGLAELEVVLRIERDLHSCDARRLAPRQTEDLSLHAPEGK
jgi:Beta-lactamase superfamily domain